MDQKIAVVSKYDKEEYMNLRPAGHEACPGCGGAIMTRYIIKPLKGKVVIFCPPGCSGTRVLTAQDDVRMLDSPFGSIAGLASGLKRALVARGDNETVVVARGGDGATFDIGFGMMSAAAARNEDILYFCNDNEAYQTTGVQESSSTPAGSWTNTNPLPTPKKTRKKDIMSIMAAHGIPYAASASVAYPEDAMRKVEKASAIKGFRFIVFLVPCPTGWQYPPRLTIKLARLAVETGVHQLFEVENGVNYTISIEQKGIPVEEYLKPQRRFAHLTSEEIAEFQKQVNRNWERLKWLAGKKW